MNRLLPALLLLAVLPAQAEIYKWVDEKGRTHFGEVVPDKYQKSSTSLSPQPMNTIQGSALRGPARQGSDPTGAGTSAAPEANPATPARQSAAEQCRAQQERFRKSQECFARYRNANGSVRPEATQNCEDIPQPPLCE